MKSSFSIPDSSVSISHVWLSKGPDCGGWVPWETSQQKALHTSLKLKPHGLKGFALLLSLFVLDNESFPACFLFLLTGYFSSLITNHSVWAIPILVTPTTSVFGRLAVEEQIWKTRWEEKKWIQGIYLQSCSHAAVLPVLKCYLLRSRCSNACLSHLCSYMDNY